MKQASWHIGMPAASYAADPDSNLDEGIGSIEGAEMAMQLDYFTTFVSFFSSISATDL